MREVITNIVMNITSQKTKNIIHNPHFWTITCTMTVLVLLYNASLVGMANLFPWLEDMVTARGIYVFVLSFLFLIPLVHASAVFRLRGALVTWFVFLAAILPRVLYESPDFESLLRVALFALVALLLGMFVALDYKPGLEQRAGLGRTRAARWISLARILKVQEYERRRVARELHDNTIQSLLVIANHVNALEAGNYGSLSPETRKQIEGILVMLLHAVDDVRRLSYDLKPSILDNVGLLPALKWFAERLTLESGIRIEVRVNGRGHRLRPEFEIVMLRIAQDALNNVAQHSRATQAIVTLDFVTSNFKITVRDNGQGFCLPEKISDFAAKGKLGLERMRQQAKLVDGTFNVWSEPGKGTVITVEAAREGINQK
jgi:two-component system sensor histidine kinase DegS